LVERYTGYDDSLTAEQDKLCDSEDEDHRAYLSTTELVAQTLVAWNRGPAKAMRRLEGKVDDAVTAAASARIFSILAFVGVVILLLR
jgi:hypothetical protein